MTPRLPLEGIRVLELAKMVTGPFCGVLSVPALSIVHLVGCSTMTCPRVLSA